jgi:hypothetical protein
VGKTRMTQLSVGFQAGGQGRGRLRVLRTDDGLQGVQSSRPALILVTG